VKKKPRKKKKLKPYVFDKKKPPGCLPDLLPADALGKDEEE
jgi:hypothetical protein